MPFCNKCGNQVKPGDQFCGQCGASQPGQEAQSAAPKATRNLPDYFSTLDAHTAATLCYVPFLGGIVSIFVLAAQRFRRDNLVRFHAFQGLYLFVVWLINDWVIEEILFSSIPSAYLFTRAIRLSLTAGWIYMLYKTSQREMVRIPVLAELADKSVAEQR